MTTKKTMGKSVNAGHNGHNGQPGYLGRLKLLHRDHELPIRVLNACQIRRRNADPATVAKYTEMLGETEPPNIIVILDDAGRHYIADGHNRTAAALGAGRSVIKADVYSGAVSDAKRIGLECNQHGLALSLAERKAALDELLDTDGHGFTDSELARMTGLDRHTIERRRRERQSGDFIAATGKVRRMKTPEEMILQAATAFARQVEKHGPELVPAALGMLPAHIREDAMRQMACEKESV
jgi:hypothetical protein